MAGAVTTCENLEIGVPSLATKPCQGQDVCSKTSNLNGISEVNKERLEREVRSIANRKSPWSERAVCREMKQAEKASFRSRAKRRYERLRKKFHEQELHQSKHSSILETQEAVGELPDVPAGLNSRLQQVRRGTETEQAALRDI